MLQSKGVYCGTQNDIRVVISIVGNNTAMFPVGHTTPVRVMMSILGNNTAMFTFGHKTCVGVKMFTVGHTIRRHVQNVYCWAHNVSELSCLLWVTQMG